VPELLTNSNVIEIGEKHKKTPAQVLLRHSLQKGLVVIPKSTNPARVRQNFEIFDFELDDEDMDSLSVSRIILNTRSNNAQASME
ncbi:unnamed protein product, partial [Acanthoscelides obtectus]